MNPCTDCPRECGAERGLTAGTGVCGAGLTARVARAAPHFGEEPCVSGERGSGTVFFSGCSLGCVYCQNYEINKGQRGALLNSAELREKIDNLVSLGVHNINLVTATHYLEAVIEALSEPLPIPVIWNSSGYESLNTLVKLEGYVDVYMPDFKYEQTEPAMKYSSAPDYPETAVIAIREMFRQTGPYVLGEDGMIQSGVIIRHLILPDNIQNTFAVIDRIASEFKPGEVLFSLMSQYTPARKQKYPELNRMITPEEYNLALGYLEKSPIEDGFFQDPPTNAEAGWIPEWDL